MTTVDYSELLNAADIARLLGVSRQRGHEVASSSSFPAPVLDVPGKRLWEPRAVEAWIAEHRPARA